ncbi:Uncharacterised protein [Mycobacteroides abscessus subsp. abscessus]|nr:Uncharacterised protein [Mycobacteroides abscessus subsp. abscessus]
MIEFLVQEYVFFQQQIIVFLCFRCRRFLAFFCRRFPHRFSFRIFSDVNQFFFCSSFQLADQIIVFRA